MISPLSNTPSATICSCSRKHFGFNILFIYFCGVLALQRPLPPPLFSPAHERPKRMVGGLLADIIPWQAMVYLGEGVFDGGFAGGALISDRWVLTAGRNLFIRRSRNDTKGKEPLIPKIYLGISHRSRADASKEVAVEKVSQESSWYIASICLSWIAEKC